VRDLGPRSRRRLVVEIAVAQFFRLRPLVWNDGRGFVPLVHLDALGVELGLLEVERCLDGLAGGNALRTRFAEGERIRTFDTVARITQPVKGNATLKEPNFRTPRRQNRRHARSADKGASCGIYSNAEFRRHDVQGVQSEAGAMVGDVGDTTCVDMVLANEERQYVAIDRRAADGAALEVGSRLEYLLKRRHAGGFFFYARSATNSPDPTLKVAVRAR
jgi:hypothetical protein